jgi:hypothetical protein
MDSAEANQPINQPTNQPTHGIEEAFSTAKPAVASESRLILV